VFGPAKRRCICRCAKRPTSIHIHRTHGLWAKNYSRFPRARPSRSCHRKFFAMSRLFYPSLGSQIRFSTFTNSRISESGNLMALKTKNWNVIPKVLAKQSLPRENQRNFMITSRGYLPYTTMLSSDRRYFTRVEVDICLWYLQVAKLRTVEPSLPNLLPIRR
jgi:hypothetical protein